ncbi:hypothetical protein ACTPEF_24445, partial [Clostridioides difficile]
DFSSQRNDHQGSSGDLKDNTDKGIIEAEKASFSLPENSYGQIPAKWLGKCPECTKWNTFVEEIDQKSTKKEVFIIDKSSSKPVS